MRDNLTLRDQYSGIWITEAFLGDTLLPLLGYKGQQEKHLEILKFDMVLNFLYNYWEIKKDNNGYKEFKGMIVQHNLEIIRDSNGRYL